MNDDDSDSDCSDDDSDCSDEEDKRTSNSDKDNEGDGAVGDKVDKDDDNEINEDDKEDDNDAVEEKDDKEDDNEINEDDKEDDNVINEYESVINVNTLQNQITDHYLDHWNKVGTLFSSNKIKYVTKTWKTNHNLNIGKLIGIFREHDEGFIDFNKWRIDNINLSLQINYSASNNSKRLIIMDDLMTKLNLSNNCKVFRALDNKKSIVMNELEIKISLRLLFRTQVSYLNINKLKPGFWNNIYESWCKHINDETTRAYDLSNHTLVPKKEEVKIIRVTLKVFMEDSVLSVL